MATPDDPVQVDYPLAVSLTNIYRIEESAVWKATLELFGGMHHAYFIEVEEIPDHLAITYSYRVDATLQVPVNDPSDYYEDLRKLNEDAACFSTMEVPWAPGKRFVMLLVPFED